MNFRYSHTFQVKDGIVQPPKPKPAKTISDQRENEKVDLLYNRFLEINQKLSAVVRDSVNLDQKDIPKPAPPRFGWLGRIFAKPADPTWGTDLSPFSGEVKLKDYNNHMQLCSEVKFDPGELKTSEDGSAIIQGVEEAKINRSPRLNGPTVKIYTIENRSENSQGQADETVYQVSKFFPGTYHVANPMGMNISRPSRPKQEWVDSQLVYNRTADTLTILTDELTSNPAS
jgi:hypothetical protein